jgi:hypothetical protein
LTGSEPWFAAFADIHAYDVGQGHKLIPLRRRGPSDHSEQPRKRSCRACCCRTNR